MAIRRNPGAINSPGAYTYLDGIVTSDFWGTPVVQDSNGNLSCPGFTGPTYAKNVADFVWIGVPYTSPEEPRTPGIAEVSCNKFRDLDKKKAPGSDGARLTIHGVEPALIEIRLTIWTPQQLKVLNTLWSYLFPKANKRPKSLPASDPWPPAWDVNHPTFTTHDVKSVVFIGGEGPSPGGVPRSRVFTMRAVEFLPTIKGNVVASPVESIGSTHEEGAAPETVIEPPGENSENTQL